MVTTWPWRELTAWVELKLVEKLISLKSFIMMMSQTLRRAAQLAERLISQDGVEYMLGPYSSGLTKAMAPVTEKYGVPMVEANGASRSLFTKGYKYLICSACTSKLIS